MYISNKKITSFIVTLTTLFGLSNLTTPDNAQAYSVTFSNGSFQNSIDFNNGFGDGWDGRGDVSVQGTYSNVAPYPAISGNTLQALITTACPTGSASECINRNDDSPTSIGTFNKSGNDQISASIEATNNLQSILGLSDNAFSIYREINGVTYDGTNGNPLIRRTPKEGSAIFQDIVVNNDGNATETKITFNYDFLTNDGAGDLGNKDFGFFSITNASGYQEIIPLEDSTGTIPTLNSGATNYATNTNSYGTYSFTKNLASGTYRVGFGVVDIDGVSYSSGLLLDEFNVEEVPFEFTPSLGLIVCGTFFGFFLLQKKLKANKIN